MFEIIAYEIIYKTIKGSLSLHQHGFMPKRSTLTNLLRITQFMSEVLDSQAQVDVIYTASQKAFDQIDHYLLLSFIKVLSQMNIGNGKIAGKRAKTTADMHGSAQIHF